MLRNSSGLPEGRRDFLMQVAATSALLLSRRGLGLAEVAPASVSIEPAVSIGVIGLGAWGREMLETLARLPGARVAAIADTYAPFLKKGLAAVPSARALSDGRAVIDAADVEAVVVCTPTYRHKDLALAALQAGKHVYCEAPLAASMDEARAVASAALASKVVFQGGLQGRSNALRRHVAQFVKSGVLGTPVMASAHWARKDSWRRAAPTPAREAELNWRLSAATSPGLAGEVGIHAFDLVSDYLGSMPVAATGYGTVVHWKDGRDVADTVQCLLDYPGGVRLLWEATLASSTGGAFTLVRGANSSVMIRDHRAWLFKEADSPLLGWEVYARKESVLEETGIALIADSTRILAAGEEPGKVGSVEPARDPLVLALEAFLSAVRNGTANPCGPQEALRATVVALQTEAAVRMGGRVALPSEALEPA
ncbi:MAG TPA: Gfo/Idh/MocA family oxidoreductase [Vicinamibacteria bacterium]|nr:Gfo/Idh/MocA family oxidoreductase [Vicinamibacteria bacterium]